MTTTVPAPRDYWGCVHKEWGVTCGARAVWVEGRHIDPNDPSGMSPSWDGMAWCAQHRPVNEAKEVNMTDLQIRPYLYRMIEVQLVAGKHNKFYRGYLDQQTFEVFFQYGKNGHEGSWTEPKPNESLEAGNAALMKQIQAKLKKGYWMTQTLTITCANRALPERLDLEIGRHQRTGGGDGVLAIANI